MQCVMSKVFHNIHLFFFVSHRRKESRGDAAAAPAFEATASVADAPCAAARDWRFRRLLEAAVGRFRCSPPPFPDAAGGRPRCSPRRPPPQPAAAPAAAGCCLEPAASAASAAAAGEQPTRIATDNWDSLE